MQNYVVNIIVDKTKTRLVSTNNADTCNAIFIILNNLKRWGLLKVDEVELTVE